MVLPTPPASIAAPDGILSLVLDGAPRSFLLFDPTFVGSSRECPVRLFGAAPVHCKLRRQSGRWMVEVEPGAADIQVNGRRVRFSRLTPGDVIRVTGVDLRFHLASRDSLGPSHPSLQSAPPAVATVAGNGTSLDALARKSAELDVAQAALEAERAAWTARIEMERQQFEAEQEEWRQFRQESDAAARRQQAEWEAKAAERNGKLDERELALDAREQALDARDAALRLACEQHEQTVAQTRAVQNQEAEFLRRQRQAAQRLLALAQQRMSALGLARRTFAQERADEEAARQQITLNVSVRRQELAGLTERIARERSLLIQIQRERQRCSESCDWNALHQTRSTASLVSAFAPSLAPAVMASETAAKTDSRQTAEALALLVHGVERAVATLEDADRRQALQAKRLIDLASQLERRERTSTRHAETMATFEGSLPSTVEDLRAERTALLRERSAFERERALWEHVRGLETAALRRDRERLREQRQRILIMHRRRSRRHRQQWDRLRRERRTLDLRFGQMLRLEARLESLRGDLISKHVAILESKERTVDDADRLPAQAAKLLQERDLLARNYESRLARILDTLERGSDAPAPLWTLDARRLANAELDLEHFFLKAQFDADRRLWQSEREQFQSTIASLESQIENLAAGLVMEAGFASHPARSTPRAA